MSEKKGGAESSPPLLRYTITVSENSSYPVSKEIGRTHLRARTYPSLGALFLAFLTVLAGFFSAFTFATGS